MKIAIMGTHGVGKTTLAYALAAKYKIEGKNVKLINETARTCPFDLNENFSPEAAQWIYHTHINKELSAMSSSRMVVCDRSALDSFMYAKAMGMFKVDQINLLYAFYGAQEWMKSYSRIIYLKKGARPPEDDGTRSTSLEFQKKIENCFDEWVENHKDNLPIEITTSDKIFSQLEAIEI